LTQNDQKNIDSVKRQQTAVRHQQALTVIITREEQESKERTN